MLYFFPIFFILTRRPPPSTLFPYTNALPIFTCEIFHVHADECHMGTLARCGGGKQRCFAFARFAPRRPEVHDEAVPAQLVEPKARADRWTRKTTRPGARARPQHAEARCRDAWLTVSLCRLRNPRPRSAHESVDEHCEERGDETERCESHKRREPHYGTAAWPRRRRRRGSSAESQ